MPGCCPHWDDAGETPRYCALALVMAAVLSGTARPGGEGGAGHGAAALAVRLCACLAPQTRAGSSAREEIPSLG